MPNESLPVPASIRPTACRMFIGPTSANWENVKKTRLPFGRWRHSHFASNRLSYRADSDTPNLDVFEFAERRSSSDFKPITDSLTQYQSSSAFTTPNEDIQSFPITPPHWKQTSPNDDLVFSLSLPAFDTGTLQERDRVVSPSPPAAPIASTTNFPLAEHRPTDATESISSEPVVHGSSSVTSNTVLKKGRMLVRVEYVRKGGIEEGSKRCTARFSMGWKEYKVVLYREKLNICIGQGIVIEEFNFSEDVRLSLYSSLDYTIALRRLSQHDGEIFLLRSGTYTNNFQWYRELHRLFKRRCVKPLPLMCDVFVPDLDVHVRIPVDEYDDAYEMTAEKVKNTVLQQLRVVQEWGEILNEWLGSDQVALCWKKYDRLEWIRSNNSSDTNSKGFIVGPQYIEETHNLQLRRIAHYPIDVMLKGGSKMNEPAAVEGFLTVLTNDKGKNKRGRRLYFTAHDNFLFYTKQKFVKEPPSPVTTIMNATTEQRCQSDERSDRERRIHHIKYSLGFIDLTEVAELSQGVRSNLSNPTEEQPSSDMNSKIMQLVLKNGLAVMLEAHSSDTTKEWVSRLCDLVKYWQARRAADTKDRIFTAKANNQSIRYGDGDDSRFWTEDVHNKVAHSHAYANPYAWNMCVPNGCRDITKSGVLYCRPHSRYTFEKFHFILAWNNLLYYDLYSRNISGRAIPCTRHKRRGIIRLHDCYAYSGSIDSSAVDSSSELPCIYSDQTFSIDEEDDCTFIIWKNTRRYCFGKGRSSISLKKKAKLDSFGKRWIFRAKNRTECEEWVYALNIEIERARDSIKSQRNGKK